jgi:hypothetical protein
MRYGKAHPGFFQKPALMPAARQPQKVDRLPANQLGFGRDLETNSGGPGLLRRHPIAAALGLLVLLFLRFGDNIIFLGSRGRRGGGGLLGAIGGRVRRAAGGGAGFIFFLLGFGAEGGRAWLARRVTNGGRDANVTIVVAVFLRWAEGDK